MKCFLDFRPGGSLSYILLTILRFKYDNNIKKFDFNTVCSFKLSTDSAELLTTVIGYSKFFIFLKKSWYFSCRVRLRSGYPQK